MELLIGSGEQHQFSFVQALFDDVDKLLAESLDVQEVDWVDDGQPLRGLVIVETIVAPGGEVVVELAVRELRTEERPPEVMIDRARVDITQDVAQFAQGLSPATGGDYGQSAVLDCEFDHSKTSSRLVTRFRMTSRPPRPRLAAGCLVLSSRP